MLKILLSVFILTQLCSAQAQIFASREIKVSDSRPIEAPPFSYFGESQCDRDGNMYFHGGDSEFRYEQVFRLSRDGTSGKFFRITGKFADTNLLGFDSFWVSPDGEVFILAPNAQETYVFTFDRDGTMKDDPLVLKVREDIQLTDFAVFDNGFFFVWGYYDERSPQNLRGKRYGAVLSDSGEVIRELSIPLSQVDLANLSAPSDGAAASYAGNLYFLGTDQIAVVSVTGETIRKLKFHKPDPQAFATKLYLSAGMAVIALNKVSTSASTKGQVQRSFIALDVNSGNLMGHYAASPQIGWDACYSRNEGLTFLQVEGKTQNLITGLLR